MSDAAEVLVVTCPECGKEYSGPMARAHLGSHRKRAHGGEVPTGDAPIYGADESPDPEPVPKRRFSLLGGSKKKAPKPKGAPKERRPTPVYGGRRVSLSELGTGVWKGLSWATAQSGYVAASRAFALQADAAGPAFDRMVKGSPVDRVLQPIAKLGENGRDIAALAALPPAAETYARQPNEMTATAFKAALVGALPQIARAHKETVKKYQRLEADLAGMAEMFGKPAGYTVSLDEIASWLIFGSTEGPPPEEPARPEDDWIEAEVVA